VLALTIKIKEKSAPEPVTLAPLLLPFKEIKGLNIKILRSSFLFGGEVPKAKGEDSNSNRSKPLENVFIASSL
jgi:hypothetical protein